MKLPAGFIMEDGYPKLANKQADELFKEYYDSESGIEPNYEMIKLLKKGLSKVWINRARKFAKAVSMADYDWSVPGMSGKKISQTEWNKMLIKNYKEL